MNGGAGLIGAFQTALMNRAISQQAVAEAERSERATLAALNTYQAARNGIFIAAGDIPVASLDDLSRRSLDAHLKKAQTGQITAYTAEQLAQLQAEADRQYVGRAVRVRILIAAVRPVEAVWFDSHTNQSRTSPAAPRQLKGSISEIHLDRNLLVIRPTRTSRLLVRGREYFLVYPIDPDTIAPAVSLEL